MMEATTAARPNSLSPAGTLVFMFPGQSSREPRMIEKIIAADSDSAATVARASAILGRDLAAHYRAANEAIFACNRDIQIGVFLANHLHLSLLQRAGIRADWPLGLSLGEYNHLIHIGALSFEDALQVIDERGRLYDEGPRGIMVSVFPIEAEMVEGVIAGLGLSGRVAVGLYNTPRQQVLSGERGAVHQVVAALEEETLIDAVEIEPRIPMHAPPFAPVAERLRAVLDRAPMKPPRLPYVPNTRGTILDAAAADQIRDCLVAHVCEPVRWQNSIDAIAARIPDACFVEVGPRSVLYNMFGRGWSPGRRARTDAAEEWEAHFRALTEELRDAA